MKTWRDIEELANRATLQQLINEHGTPTRIARCLGCSVTSVKHAMKFYGLTSKKYKIGDDTKKLLKL